MHCWAQDEINLRVE